MIRKSRPSDLIRGWEPVFAKDHDLVPGITNRYCSPSFETATEPVIGRAFARPVGGLLRMRSNLLKHNNLMLRSERRERLEAWAASDSPISHSQYQPPTGGAPQQRNGSEAHGIERECKSIYFAFAGAWACHRSARQCSTIAII